MPRVTYIVSAFNRPASLPCCLWSLKVQTDADFEVIVADNSIDRNAQLSHERAVHFLDDPRFSRVDTAKRNTSPAWDCYWSAEWVVANCARGEWICLPSDDSYYVPVFQETLLKAATEKRWKFVYCDMLYDRRMHGRYEKLDVQPWRGAIDKTGFLIRRDSWIGFPLKPTDAPRASTCDGDMAAELVKRGVPHGKVNEVLVVHN